MSAERFILREDHRRSLPFVIVRQIEDNDFLPGEPVWVDGGEIGAFPSRDAARDFMRRRQEASDAA
jgi:hypothetical protein